MNVYLQPLAHEAGLSADVARTAVWVSLALQVYYPDFFQGAWSHCPDPVDFRAYELMDIYRDDNAYVNAHGFERPAARERNGDVVYTVRHECLVERVLGRGDRWQLSGKDWCCWNAVFGPRGGDGLPIPLWDGKTGKIDRGVVEHWKRYDLRLVLQQNWPALGPRLRGKLHIWVGEADDYFLNNAVHLLDDFLRQAKPPAEHRISYGPGQGHSWRGLSEAQMMKEMAESIESLNGRADVKAILLQSSQQAFSAGISLEDSRPDRVFQTLDAFTRVFQAMVDISKPVVVVVNGPAIGAGSELVGFADVVLATPKAKFAQPEVKLGVFPPFAAVMLPQLIGTKKTYELILTG